MGKRISKTRKMRAMDFMALILRYGSLDLKVRGEARIIEEMFSGSLQKSASAADRELACQKLPRMDQGTVMNRALMVVPPLRCNQPALTEDKALPNAAA